MPCVCVSEPRAGTFGDIHVTIEDDFQGGQNPENTPVPLLPALLQKPEERAAEIFGIDCNGNADIASTQSDAFVESDSVDAPVEPQMKPEISESASFALIPSDNCQEEDNGLSEAQESTKEQTPRLLGIRFRKSGQVFFFPDQEHTVRKGTKVLVELEQGPALGEIASIIQGPPVLSSIEELGPPIKILGLATAQDIARHSENTILASEAEAFCKTCIRQRDMDMKLVDVEVLHDRSKIIFFFTAPSRIDFRELVKDLVRNFRTRIELRQIGVRHETQMIGGLGNCGMVCCCHRYLRKFAPVTIKMAKEQNLFLNPAKLSGMCGRLLCCLSFEQGNYEEFNRRCPKMGKKYTTPDKGAVKVLRANMFSQSISILTETGEELEVSLEEWENMTPRRVEPQQSEHLQRPSADENRKRKEHSKNPSSQKLPPKDMDTQSREDKKLPHTPGEGGSDRPHKQTRRK